MDWKVAALRSKTSARLSKRVAWDSTRSELPQGEELNARYFKDRADGLLVRGSWGNLMAAWARGNATPEKTKAPIPRGQQICASTAPCDNFSIDGR